MAQYTVLNCEEINSIVSNYAIERVNSFKVLSGGSENTNYLITCNNHKYVLTICEQKSTIDTTNLAQLLEHLATHNFLTSRPVKTKAAELISVYNEKPVLLKTFVKGRILDALPNHLLKAVGKQLGKLHKIEAPSYLPKTISYGKEHFKDVAAYASNSAFHLWLQDIETYITPYISKNLSKSLVHSDVFFSNVIIGNDNQSITIMDFEEATYYYRVFDVGMTIVGLCKEDKIVNLKKVSALFEGYFEEVALTKLERESLQAFTVYAAASMCFWRHKNFNYTNPDSTLKSHYLELKHIADFVKNLPSNTFEKLIAQT